MEAATHYATSDGLGLIEVFQFGDVVRIREEAKPQLWRRARSTFRLLEAQRDYAEAGNADGRFWSPFKETCTRVTELVRAMPGLTISEVVERVDHHYASKQSARGSLLSWVQAGRLEGVTVRGGSKDEGSMRLFPIDWEGPLRDRKMLAKAIRTRAGIVEL